LADFGLSKRIDVLVKTTSAEGVAPYIDPKKIVEGKLYSLNQKSDVYSIGVLLWEISSCRPPFKDKTLYRLITEIPKGLRETPIPNTPKDYEKIYTGKYNLKAVIMIQNIINNIAGIVNL
jgi:serine/threonine protein kinase